MSVGKGNNAPSAMGAQFGADPKAVLIHAVDTATENAYPLQMTASSGKLAVSDATLAAAVAALPLPPAATAHGGTPASVDTTVGGVSLAAANSARNSITFYNESTTVTVALGGAGVTYAAAPYLLPPGAFLSFDAAGGSRLAWRGITSAGTAAVRVGAPTS